MSCDCNCHENPLFVISPANGRFSEEARKQVRESLGTATCGRVLVVDHPVTITPIVPVALWVVGRDRDEEGEPWEFQGVFDSEAKAVAACIKPNYWIAPAVLNEAIADEWVEWSGLYYPSESHS